MRLIDADELMEHVWRDKLDSRELIAKMIETAPTVKEIPVKIPIDIFEQLISQKPQLTHTNEKSTSVLDRIRAEIRTKYDSIPWRNNDYDDGWIEALEWVLDVIDKYKAESDGKK